MTGCRVIILSDWHIAMALEGSRPPHRWQIFVEPYFIFERHEIHADCSNEKLFRLPSHCHIMSEDRSSAFASRPTSKYGQLTMIRKAVNLRKSRKYSQGIGLLLSLRSRRAACRFVCLLLPIGLASCLGNFPRDADQAKSENMVIQEDVCPTCNSNRRFAQTIQISEVQGGREPGTLPARVRGTYGAEVSNEAFRVALEESLRNNGLLAKDASQARLILNTHLIELQQPYLGSNETATSAIRYVLRKKQTGEPVRDELVEARFTAKYSDTPGILNRAYRRRRIKAVEGSIRENIKQFVVRLLTEAELRTIKSSGSSSDGRAGRFDENADQVTTVLVGCDPDSYRAKKEIEYRSDGYTDQIVGENEYSIVALGHRNSIQECTAQLALLRAARLTLEQGHQLFVIIHGSSTRQRIGTAHMIAIPGAAVPIVVSSDNRGKGQPTAILIIRLMNDDEAQPGAFDAKAIEGALAPKFE